MIKRTKRNTQKRIAAFKHTGENYRNWSPAYELVNNDEYILLYSPKRKTRVYGNKKPWKPSASIIWYMPKHKFYNVLCMYKEDLDKLEYYINIATPPKIMNHRIGFIDYDIDFKIDINKKIEKRDEKEFLKHSEEFNYSERLITKIRDTEQEILKNFHEGRFPFYDNEIKRYLRENEK